MAAFIITLTELQVHQEFTGVQPSTRPRPLMPCILLRTMYTSIRDLPRTMTTTVPRLQSNGFVDINVLKPTF